MVFVVAGDSVVAIDTTTGPASGDDPSIRLTRRWRSPASNLPRQLAAAAWNVRRYADGANTDHVLEVLTHAGGAAEPSFRGDELDREVGRLEDSPGEVDALSEQPAVGAHPRRRGSGG